ncbi:MAG: homoserine dehydrogenase, partial [Thermogutta sp.]|nr:homoserine dehydrogenase [Thermogutta sp.]
MQSVKVGILGFGTIGSGTARLLLDHRERIRRRAGCSLELARIVDKDLARPRNVAVPRELLSDDVDALIRDPDIRIVAELIGGLEPARTLVAALLENGKDVVTANKALLAEHGPELFELARRHGRSIAFEAAVAGGIPIIAAIAQSLTANEIGSIHAILNGTSNFILTEMEEKGEEYSAALAEAQRLGYAEANPAMDVNGSDAAQKLAILARLAFCSQVSWRDIPRVGIETVQAADMRYARELGYSIKLLAVAERTGQGLQLHVSPTLVRRGTPLAEVRGPFNAVRVVGDAVGRVFFHGLGAGQMPTASAVTADIIDTAVGRAAITFRNLRLWERDGDAPVLQDAQSIAGRFYLRFHVQDRPGVLAEIAGILGKNQISIASVIQHEAEEGDGGAVPLVIMTHEAREGAMSRAMDAID